MAVGGSLQGGASQFFELDPLAAKEHPPLVSNNKPFCETCLTSHLLQKAQHLRPSRVMATTLETAKKEELTKREEITKRELNLKRGGEPVTPGSDFSPDVVKDATLVSPQKTKIKSDIYGTGAAADEVQEQ
ncbi:hypothetical protein JCM5353_003391 [Sporobolomyces roseus]